MLQNRDVHWILVQLSVRLEWLYLTGILFLLYTLYNNLTIIILVLRRSFYEAFV